MDKNKSLYSIKIISQWNVPIKHGNLCVCVCVCVCVRVCACVCLAQ